MFNDTDAKTSTKVKYLLTSTLDFEFVICLAILKIILPNRSKLSYYVQSSTIDISKVKVNADLTIKTLESCRNEANYDLIWDCVNLRCGKIKEFLEEEDIDFEFKEPRLPRNIPENVSDMKSYQTVTNYYPSLDRVVSESQIYNGSGEAFKPCSTSY